MAIIPKNAAGRLLAGDPSGQDAAVAVKTGQGINLVYNPVDKTYTLNTAGSSGVTAIKVTASGTQETGVITFVPGANITLTDVNGTITIAATDTYGAKIYYGSTVPVVGTPTANTGDWYFLTSTGTPAPSYLAIVSMYVYNGTAWIQYQTSPNTVTTTDPSTTITDVINSVPLNSLVYVIDTSTAKRIYKIYRRETYSNPTITTNFVSYGLPGLDAIVNSDNLSSWVPNSSLASNTTNLSISVGAITIFNNDPASLTRNKFNIASQTVNGTGGNVWNYIQQQVQNDGADLVFKLSMQNTQVSTKYRFSAYGQSGTINNTQDFVIDVGLNTQIIRFFAESGWQQPLGTTGQDGNTADVNIALQVENPMNISSAKMGGVTANAGQTLVWNPTALPLANLGAWVPSNLIKSVKSGASGTVRTGDVTFLAGTNMVIVDNGNNSFTFNASGGTAISTASFIANPISGTAPLTVTLTDSSTPTPDSWLWTITPSTYTLNSGTLTSNELNVTLNRSVQYTITMTPTKAGTTYSPVTASSNITPSFVSGDFSLIATFQPPLTNKVRTFRDFQTSDYMQLVFTLLNSQQCTSVTSATITASNNSTAPALSNSVTPTTINTSATTNTLTIPDTVGGTPYFIDANGVLGLTFTATVVAVFNQTDGTTISRTKTDSMRYYVPAYYRQTNSSTVPAMDGATEVFADNYVQGQTFPMVSNSNNWIWIAVPTSLTTLNVYVVDFGSYTTFTPDATGTQNIGFSTHTVAYKIFGYNAITISRNATVYIGVPPQ